MGANDSDADKAPNVIKSLQNRGVISIVLGDYHFGALLESGKLLTWGAATCTGLGNPFEIETGKPGGFRDDADKERGYVQRIPDIVEPAEVRFDHNLKEPRERFVFSAVAAGWHMGALLVDLEEVLVSTFRTPHSALFYPFYHS
jgi:SCF-associated factor 1